MHFLELTTHLRLPEDNDWVLQLFIASLAVLSICKIFFAKNFMALGNLEDYLNVNDNSALFSMIINFLLLVFVSILVVPYFDISAFNPSFTRIAPFFIVMGLLLTVVLFRLLFEVLFFYAFDVTTKLSTFLRSSSYMNFRSLVILMLATLLFYYSELNKTYILGGWVVLLILFRLFDLYFRYIDQKKVNPLHWYYYILYLCALEILPTIVLIKLITNWQ